MLGGGHMRMNHIVTLSTLLALCIQSSHAIEFSLSSRIPSKHKELIRKDLKILSSIKFKKPQEKTLELLKLKEVNAATMEKWLGDRVKYVLGENDFSNFRLLTNQAIFVANENQVYPNYVQPTEVIEEEKEKEKEKIQTEQPSLEGTQEEAQVTMVMANIGAAVYMIGKKSKSLLGVKLSRGLLKKPEKIVVKSPRVGIIQIGEGLFHKGFNPNKTDDNAYANSLSRLGTFFHEARHSDGNGQSLAFSHVICPKDHPYAGAAACDSNLNGPYAIGAFALREFIKSCDAECTKGESEFLNLMALDEYSRVIEKDEKGVPAKVLDDTPESI